MGDTHFFSFCPFLGFLTAKNGDFLTNDDEYEYGDDDYDYEDNEDREDGFFVFGAMICIF